MLLCRAIVAQMAGASITETAQLASVSIGKVTKATSALGSVDISTLRLEYVVESTQSMTVTLARALA